MNKVYFNFGLYEGCNYVRCLLPMLHNGWDGDQLNIYAKKKNPVIATKAMLASDMVVMHRPMEQIRKDIFLLLKESGKKIVFDNDDTYKVNDTMKLGKSLDALDSNIDWFIKNADLVTTTTEYLAEEYRKLNKNVVVLPNCIDPNDREKPIKNKGNKVRIGLVGSTAGIEKDFSRIRDLLKELSLDERVQLVIFGVVRKDSVIADKYESEISFWDSLNIDWIPPVPIKDYPKVFRSLELDILLIPREDNYFNRCKSNIKFLEASILEIPVIAQGFDDGKSPYQGNDEPYMKICKRFSEWEIAVEELIKNKELRQQMGKDARKYVLANYDIRKKAKLWKEAYKKLWDNIEK